MQTAKLFKNGNSQAVRLPKEFRFAGKEVYVRQVDNVVMLIPKNDPWSLFVKSLDKFPPNFMEDRTELPEKKRKFFK